MKFEDFNILEKKLSIKLFYRMIVAALFLLVSISTLTFPFLYPPETTFSFILDIILLLTVPLSLTFALSYFVIEFSRYLTSKILALLSPILVSSLQTMIVNMDFLEFPENEIKKAEENLVIVMNELNSIIEQKVQEPKEEEL